MAPWDSHFSSLTQECLKSFPLPVPTYDECIRERQFVFLCHGVLLHLNLILMMRFWTLSWCCNGVRFGRGEVGKRDLWRRWVYLTCERDMNHWWPKGSLWYPIHKMACSDFWLLEVPSHTVPGLVCMTRNIQPEMLACYFWDQVINDIEASDLIVPSSVSSFTHSGGSQLPYLLREAIWRGPCGEEQRHFSLSYLHEFISEPSSPSHAFRWLYPHSRTLLWLHERSKHRTF